MSATPTAEEGQRRAENERAIAEAQTLGLTMNPKWLEAPLTKFIFHPMVVKEERE